MPDAPFEFLAVNLNSRSRLDVAAVRQGDTKTFSLNDYSWHLTVAGRLRRSVFDKEEYASTGKSAHSYEYLADRVLQTNMAWEGPAVIHFANGDPLDCRVENLVWKIGRQELAPSSVVSTLPGYREFLHNLRTSPTARPDSVPRGPKAKLTPAQVRQLVSDTHPLTGDLWVRTRTIEFIRAEYIPHAFDNEALTYSNARLWEILTGRALKIPGYDYTAHRAWFGRPNRRTGQPAEVQA